jgi:hypothetical protein
MGENKSKVESDISSVDTQGLLLAVVVSEENMPERVGKMAVLLEVESQLSNLSLIWVDQGYLLDPSFKLQWKS